MKRYIIIAALMVAGLVQAGVTTITFKNTWQSDTDAAPAIINQSATGVTMDRGQPDVVVSAANRVYQEGADLTGSNGKTLAKGEVLVWSFDVTPVTIVDKADRHFRFSLWDGESDGFSARVDWGAAGGTVLNMGWNNNAATAESIGNYKYGTLIQSSVSPTLDLGQTTTPVHFEVSILKNAINATTYDVTLKIDDLILTHQFTGVDRFNDVSLAGFLMSDEQASSFTVSNMSMQVIPKPAISNVRSSPSANSDILLGGESADTSSQTVKYNALLNEALLGQTFTLASIGAAEDYKLTDLYLKAGSSEDWDLTSGNFEIKILQGTGGAVLGTYSYDAKAKGNGVGQPLLK